MYMIRYPSLLFQINENDSVAQILDSHVWTLCSNVFVCNLRVEVFPGTDLNRLRSLVKTYLSQVSQFLCICLPKLFSILDCCL